ncbi:DUF3667 domain-containing protein [Roseiterribacter gracilis]|uniref:DUF3667 domain-containing protein n=1 Tax=Roseiterribacter gracilis TaxID=2812848 RepID=A0A8S8XEU3_9PROT|nr:hypothetical protein TMPK1_27590 [Rhodospirillales bacterium TMPK1]
MLPTTTLHALEGALAIDAAGTALAAGAQPGEHQACQNCGTALQGPYCHHCGQYDEKSKRPWWILVEHAPDSPTRFQSRILRSYAWLLLRPGRMTAAFLAGQRARFVPPIRLYIFTSLIFFLALGASGLVLVQPVSERIQHDGDTDNNVTFELLAPPRKTPVLLPGDIQHEGDGVIKIGRKGKQKKINIDQLVELVNDPVKMSAFLTEWLPRVLVAAMPIFALLLGLLYIRRRRGLIDHLVLTLHLHAFLFEVGVLLIGLRVATGISLPAFALPLLLSVYFLLTIKRVYRQNWFKTCVKSFILFLAYPNILLLAAVALAIWT